MSQKGNMEILKKWSGTVIKKFKLLYFLQNNSGEVAYFKKNYWIFLGLWWSL